MLREFKRTHTGDATGAIQSFRLGTLNSLCGADYNLYFMRTLIGFLVSAVKTSLLAVYWNTLRLLAFWDGQFDFCQ